MSLHKDQKLDNYNLQSIQIYLQSCCLYDFDQQKKIWATYINKNAWAYQKYRKHDKNNI